MRAIVAPGRIDECRRLVERKCNAWKKVPLNVAVIGNSGVGKSSFINAIRGLNADDERAAKVGADQTTMEPRSYPHPVNQMLLLCDLPGVGTDKFRRETYLTDINVDHYDFFVLMTATRFTENDAWFGEEFRRRKKKYLVVRTKIQQDVDSDKDAHPMTHNEEAVVNGIRELTITQLKQSEYDYDRVFLIDNYKPNKFDFEKLKLQLIEAYPVTNKSALLLSLQADSDAVQDDDQETTIDLLTVEEMKAAVAAGGVDECRRLLERKSNAWKNVPLNMAVIGNSGVGKSSFINAIRGLNADDEGAAEVGANQTTMEPRSYPHPDNQMMLLWDLPGVGTKQFPRATYLAKIDVDRYDFFLLMTAGRFTENDTWLGNEFSRRKKKYFFVRTKIQQDVDSDKDAHPRSHKEETVVNGIRKSTIMQLKESGCEYDRMFLIDNYKPNKFDFERLKLQLIEDFPAMKKSALLLSLQADSEQMIRLKVRALRSRIWKLAALSAAVGAVPIPGPSIVADLAIVAGESWFYFKQLGLDDKSLRRCATLYSVDYDKLKSIVGSALGLRASGAVTADVLKTAVLVILRLAPALASSAAGVAEIFLPIIGSLISAPVSFAGTYLSLKLVLDKFEEVAIDVMKCAAESVANAQLESGTAEDASGKEGAQSAETSGL